MAAIFFCKTGRDENRASRQVQLEVSVLAGKLGAFETTYSQIEPLFDANTPTPEYGGIRVCVASIDADEVCARFPQEGY